MCTENLTPWGKLLPCSTTAGLASLLNPSRIFNTPFHQFDVNLRASGKSLELRQNLLVVFDVRRHDETLEWSVTYLFGKGVKYACPIAESTVIDIKRPHTNKEGWKTVEIIGEADSIDDFKESVIRDDQMVNRDFGVIGATVKSSGLHASPIVVMRYLTGVGQERGGLALSWRNKEKSEIMITHSELLPDFMSVYFSQMVLYDAQGNELSMATLHQFHVAPSQARSFPLEISLQLLIPPQSEISLLLPFEKDFLRYTDYPFDPNRGLDVLPASTRYTDPLTNVEQVVVTTKLLLTMPTPDFTMPYNVITLTSTLIVLFYGTIFSACYRRFYRGPTPIQRKISRLVNFVKTIGSKIVVLFRRAS